MNASIVLNSNSAPSEKEIIDAQQGNIYGRCITYNRIKTAIKRASEMMQERKLWLNTLKKVSGLSRREVLVGSTGAGLVRLLSFT